MGKLIIITAPSGAGKTTIVKHLLATFNNLAFSISATSRTKRNGEVDGLDYYFLEAEQFKKCIAEDAFVEWEEVYPDLFYGTLKKEIERLWKEGKDIIFDVEVKGATNIKQKYPKETLAIYIKPPSKEALLERLSNRKTEDQNSLKMRMQRAEEELTFENKFDTIIVNDILETALHQAENIVGDFLNTN